MHSLNNTNSRDRAGNALLSDYDLTIIQWINFTFLCLTLDVFGTVTNILNIICFIKQGFKDPVNVSLLGLAISDIGCLVPMIWGSICFTPGLSALDLSFEPIEFQYLTGGWPHVTFTRVSSWITALITLERCLCVTTPLQVKNLVTPKRVAVIIIIVYIILIASVAPIYVVNSLGLKYYPARNKSLITIISTENRENVETLSYLINNVAVPFSSFMVIIVCTIILVIKLESNTKWRSKSTEVVQSGNLSSRNQKAAKMVVMISTFFIACYVPVVIVFLSMAMEPEMSMTGTQRNLAIALGGVCMVVESANSSMNIFIYYNMSSRFKAAFRQIFCRDSTSGYSQSTVTQ